MAYCTNCGKETEWTSKSGYCKACAKAVLRARKADGQSHSTSMVVCFTTSIVSFLLSCTALGAVFYIQLIILSVVAAVGFIISTALHLSQNRKKSSLGKPSAEIPEEHQDNIFYCSVGDEVEPEEDFEYDRIVAVYDGLEIGHFPKSAKKYVDEGASFFIESIDIDDNDKYIVTVSAEWYD